MNQSYTYVHLQFVISPLTYNAYVQLVFSKKLPTHSSIKQYYSFYLHESSTCSCSIFIHTYVRMHVCMYICMYRLFPELETIVVNYLLIVFIINSYHCKVSPVHIIILFIYIYLYILLYHCLNSCIQLLYKLSATIIIISYKISSSSYSSYGK